MKRGIKRIISLICIVSIIIPWFVRPITALASNPFTKGQCTWWAYERLTQLMGYEPKQIDGQPGAWCTTCYKVGYTSGKEPRVGALICWNNGEGDTNGHVAVVEAVYDTYITISEYNWGVTFGYSTANVKFSNINRSGGSRPNRYFTGYVYVYGESSPAILPGTVDSTWNVPAYVTAGYKIQTYDAWGNAEAGHYIDPGDNCYIEAVYTNGFVRVRYPVSSGDRWSYAKAQDFTLTKKNVDHVHDFAEYQFYEAVHPHYKCYKCSICGEVTRNVNEPVLIYGCESDACKYAGYGDVFYANITIGDNLALTNGTPGTTGASVKLGSNLIDRSAIWKFVKTEDNYYAIYSCADGQALEMQNGDTNAVSGQDLIVSNYQGKTHQRWAVSLMATKWWEDNLCNIVPICNTNVGIDVYDANIASGTNVWLYKRNSSVAQNFRIVVLDQDFNLKMPSIGACEGGTKSETTLYWTITDHADQYNVSIDSASGKNVVSEVVYGDNYYRKILPAGRYTATVTAVNNRYANKAAKSEPVTFEVKEETGEKTASVICGKKRYELYDYSLDWDSAKEFCASRNGKLAEVANSEEQKAIEQLLAEGKYEYYWLGLTDCEKEGTFEWTSGTALSYSNWNTGEPSNSDGAENWVMIYKENGKWNDAIKWGGLGGHTGFICETEAPKRYSISYHLNGGVNDGSNPVSYTSDNPYLSLKNPTKSNYTFDGWYTSSTYAAKLTSSTKCDGNLNLYAKWTPTPYTVQLDVNGGNQLSQSKYTATVETTGMSLPAPVWDGYTFTGWYTQKIGGDKVSSLNYVTQNMTLYARWEKNPEPHVHSYKTLVENINATCTSDGHITYRCDCGDEKTTYTSAIGHSYGDWEVVRAATYTEPGLMRRVCRNDASHVEGREIPVLVKNKTDISDCEVELSEDSFEYDGTAIKPKVDVSKNGILLTEDKDYTVSYEDNIVPGTAKVTVTGIGDYTGTCTKTFVINEFNLSSSPDKVQILGVTNKTYTGKSQTQSSLVVTVSGKALVKGKDYTVTYKNNTNIGRAVITITGIGSYTGSLSAAFRINVKNGGIYTVSYYKYRITNAAVNGTGTVTLTGTLHKRTTSNYKILGVADSVKIGGVAYKITAVGNNAFYGYKYLTTLVLGKNIRVVGNKAFYGCSGLKNTRINSTDLRVVGTNAFAGIYAKPVVKLPAARIAKYKVLMKRGGVSAKAVYTKI